MVGRIRQIIGIIPDMAISNIPNYPNFFLVDHPLVKHKLFFLRDIDTSKKKFKELVKEITVLLAYEATNRLPLTAKIVQTPLASFEAPLLSGKKPVILPILRAGLGMVDGFLELIPSARVGHIGLFRNEETLQPEKYYFKVPNHSQKRHFFILDPMLATGGSAIAAINTLKSKGLTRMTFVCLVAAPEGVKSMAEAHPEVPVYAAALDEQLNQQGYILPGLGDAGDRLFGTK